MYSLANLTKKVKQRFKTKRKICLLNALRPVNRKKLSVKPMFLAELFMKFVAGCSEVQNSADVEA